MTNKTTKKNRLTPSRTEQAKNALLKLKNSFEELSKLADQIRQELHAARMGKLNFAKRIISLYVKIYFAGFGIGVGLAITGAILGNDELRSFGWGMGLMATLFLIDFRIRFWKQYEQTEPKEAGL